MQRLGRLNRYASSDDPWPCLVYPFQGDPYNEKPELIQTRGDSGRNGGCPHSRGRTRRPAVQPAQLGKPARRDDRSWQIETYSAWLDDGWLTEPAQLRDGDQSVTLIREEDLAEIERKLGRQSTKPSRWTAKSLVPWTIPMLYRREFRPERRVGGYPVAPTGAVDYCDKEGATWRKNTN